MEELEGEEKKNMVDITEDNFKFPVLIERKHCPMIQQANRGFDNAEYKELWQSGNTQYLNQ